MLFLLTVETELSIPGVAKSGQREQRNEVGSLRSEIADLRKQVGILQSQMEQANVRFDAYRGVALDLSTPERIHRIDSQLLPFVMQVISITPHLDGQKVRIRVGNLTSATFDGFKISSRWGRPYDYSKFSKETFEQWDKSLVQKTVSYPRKLLGGQWTCFDLILTPSKPDQLGYLLVGLETGRVILTAAR